MLIDEYRKENDRCSQRITELQKKLNSTQSKFKKDKAERAKPIQQVNYGPDLTEEYLAYAFAQPYGGAALQQKSMN